MALLREPSADIPNEVGSSLGAGLVEITDTGLLMEQGRLKLPQCGQGKAGVGG